MATKLELQNLINTNLGDSPKIIPEKHREVENSFVDEFYSQEIIDTQLTTNVVTPLGMFFEYLLKITKTGNKVNISGYIKNVDTILFIGDMFEITNPLFFPLNDTPSTISLNATGSDHKFASLSTNLKKTRLFSILGVDEIMYINFTYITID